MAKSKATVDANTLRALVARIFARRGMADAAAERVAEVLVWANLGGHGSHGVSRVPRYVAFIESGALDPRATPAVARDAGAIFQVEANRSAGPVALSLAVAEAETRARAHGVTFGLVAHSTHIGAAGYYAARLADAGLIGIVFSAGGPLMTYHGTAAAGVSTAPLAIAIPAGRHPTLLLDMATSVVALGKIRQALAAGAGIPEGWALTGDGKPTTDPAQAEIQLPVGGPKGSGLALMFEAIASVLAGAPILATALTATQRQPHRQNAALIAFDVARLRPLAEFRDDIDRLVDAIKSLPPDNAAREILMPGERSQRLRARASDAGVTLDADLLAQLERLGAQGG